MSDHQEDPNSADNVLPDTSDIEIEESWKVIPPAPRARSHQFDTPFQIAPKTFNELSEESYSDLKLDLQSVKDSDAVGQFDPFFVANSTQKKREVIE